MRVSSDMPDDVIVLHDALEKIRNTFGTPSNKVSPPFREGAGVGLSLNLKNCGTALRFLEVHLEKCYPNEPITLTGDARLMERKGKPTSQTNSALLMHGIEVSDDSPYVEMTRKVVEMYKKNPFPSGRDGVGFSIEADWSSASYWYEYVAIHGGELLLEGLVPDSIQGDRIVADIYAKYFGVRTEFVSEGAIITRTTNDQRLTTVSLDFERIPDLYPAIALTCERLGITLHATGTERLRYKESDRLDAVRLHEVRSDHRIAMALIAADYIDFRSLDAEKKNELQTVIAKSSPQFLSNYLQISYQSRRSTDGQPTVKTNDTATFIQHITPIRGVNDDNLGKKHALSKLIHATTSDYLWLHDDDVILPPILQSEGRSYSNAVLQCNGLTAEGGQTADLLILPLLMASEQLKPSILERLQIAEYAAIQELTMRTAKAGRAVMCSGANLIVRRKAWLACESELHPEMPSGDDMFLLEAMKRHGYRVGVIDEPDYTAIVHSQTTWRAFWRQRMRWAGKAPHYTDRDIRRCGAWVVAANIAQIFFFPIILVKFPIEFSLIKKREPRTPWYVALLLEILYPIYMLVAFFGGVLRRNRW